jgi:hypothetical protein
MDARLLNAEDAVPLDQPSGGNAMGTNARSACLRLAATTIAVALQGCGTSGASLFLDRNSISDSGTNRLQDINVSGPKPVLERTKVEPINLLLMLDPEYNGQVIFRNRHNDVGASKTWSELPDHERYEYAFEAFSRFSEAPAAKAVRRNTIQDRVLLSSDQRCGIYRRVLLEVQSDANFWMGMGSTISGVLGPLFGERGAKNLSALSGAFSGSRAEFNQSYFYNLAVPVITKGIDERRKAILERIRVAQQASIDKYSVQSAIKDAVYYDSQCSVIGGLEEAAEAIRLAADPGIEAANRMLLKTKMTRLIVAANNDSELASLGERLRQIEANPLMASARFGNVGLSGAASGAAVVDTSPLAVIKVLKADLIGDDLSGANVSKQLVDQIARAKEGSSSDQTKGKQPPDQSSFSPLAQPIQTVSTEFDSAIKACVAKLQADNITYATLQGEALNAASHTQRVSAAQGLTLLAREASQAVEVFRAARVDLDSAIDAWRAAAVKQHLAGQTLSPFNPDDNKVKALRGVLNAAVSSKCLRFASP